MSPDATRVAFVSSRTGQADIWLLDLRTRRLRNLTNHPGGDYRPRGLRTASGLPSRVIATRTVPLRTRVPNLRHVRRRRSTGCARTARRPSG